LTTDYTDNTDEKAGILIRVIGEIRG